MTLDYTRIDPYWVKVVSGKYRNYEMKVIGTCNEFPDMLALEQLKETVIWDGGYKKINVTPKLIFLGKNQVQKLTGHK